MMKEENPAFPSEWARQQLLRQGREAGVGEQVGSGRRVQSWMRTGGVSRAREGSRRQWEEDGGWYQAANRSLGRGRDAGQ